MTQARPVLRARRSKRATIDVQGDMSARILEYAVRQEEVIEVQQKTRGNSLQRTTPTPLSLPLSMTGFATDASHNV